MWYEWGGETSALKRRHSSHASLTGVRVVCCPSIGVISCAIDKQYHMKPWAYSCPSDATLMQKHSPCSRIWWFVSEKYHVRSIWNHIPLSILQIGYTIREPHAMPCTNYHTDTSCIAALLHFHISHVHCIMIRTRAFLNHSEIVEIQLLMHTSWVSFLWSDKYFLKAVSSTKYTHPWLRLGSLTLLETAWHQRRKLASKATNSTSISLQDISTRTEMKTNNTTYLMDDKTAMFFPGCGHTQHKTAHSPSLVFKMPAGSCPLPKHFSILRWRHCRTSLKNCS